jgi:ABC-type bacteriocin/lantibiotic exporter with double-glycine peptidase domain
MEVHIKVIGVVSVALALAHLIFPKYFNWAEDLKPLSLINRQMMTVHTFFIALAVFMIGLLCLTSAQELTQTALGKKLCLGLGVFWAIRLFIQFFGYSYKLWKGKKFETSIHILFSFIWTYFSCVFFSSYLG